MPEVYGSAELLVAAVADGAGFTREPFDKNADSLSGSPFESVVIAGVTYVLKHLGRDIDWIMQRSATVFTAPRRGWSSCGRPACSRRSRTSLITPWSGRRSTATQAERRS